MNPPLSRADKALGVGTLLLLGLAGVWLGQLQQPFPAPAPVAQIRPAEPPSVVVPADTLPPEPEPLPDPAPDRSRSAWCVVGSPASRRLLQVRRYVGTIAGQPATAELQWLTPDSITGSFYLHRTSTTYSLGYERKRPGPVVFRVFEDGYAEEPVPSHWRLTTRPGHPTLRATWHQGRRRRVVLLRESYAGAVRYGVRTMYLVDLRDSTAGLRKGVDAAVRGEFLQLPAPATVRPVLRPLLNPGPKARRAQLDSLCEGLTTAAYQLTVRLNGFGLFSYQYRDYSRMIDSSPDVSFESTLLDLAAGQPLTIESQLRPDYELPLRRLFTQHFRHDPKFADKQEWFKKSWKDPRLVELPDQDMCLTAAGLEGVFWQPLYPDAVLIPYTELRPLVRPGTPLARMLQARGLW